MFENAVLQFVAAHLWQGLLLMPVVWVLARFLTRRNPAFRHGLWLTTLLLLAVLPLLSFVEMPRFAGDWAVGISAADGFDSSSSAGHALPASPATSGDEAASGSARPLEPESPLAPWGAALLALWLAGTALRLGQLGRDLVRSGELVRMPGLRHVPVKLLPRGWPMRVPVLTGADVAAPMMVGFRRPRVLLPLDLIDALEPAQVRSILFHELAHIERCDPWIALAERLLTAVMWWSPWAALAARQVRFEREMACDDRAVQRTGNARAYARSLVDGAARAVSVQLRPAVALGALYSSNALSERVKRLAAGTYVPGAAARPLVVIAGFALGLGSLSVALATPGARGDWRAANIISGALASSGVLASPLQRAFVESAGEVGPEDLAQMLDAGAEIDGVAGGDGTALIVAARNGRMDNVDFLIGRGADVNVPAPGDGNALIAAAGAGEVQILERLLSAGADIDAIVPGDETALITAVRNGRLAAVRLLVDAGADVNLGVMAPTIKGDVWRSPLGEALRTGRRDVADYLTEHGAKPQ